MRNLRGQERTNKNLEQLLTDQEIPNLDKIPDFMRETMQDCFNYMPELRPEAKPILTVVKSRVW